MATRPMRCWRSYASMRCGKNDGSRPRSARTSAAANAGTTASQAIRFRGEPCLDLWLRMEDVEWVEWGNLESEAVIYGNSDPRAILRANGDEAVVSRRGTR